MQSQNGRAENRRSMADFCLFLNVLPPPDICPVGIDDSDWNILLEDGWINSEGFLVHSSSDVVLNSVDPVANLCISSPNNFVASVF